MSSPAYNPCNGGDASKGPCWYETDGESHTWQWFCGELVYGEDGVPRRCGDHGALVTPAGASHFEVHARINSTRNLHAARYHPDDVNPGAYCRYCDFATFDRNSRRALALRYEFCRDVLADHIDRVHILGLDAPT